MVRDELAGTARACTRSWGVDRADRRNRPQPHPRTRRARQWNPDTGRFGELPTQRDVDAVIAQYRRRSGGECRTTALLPDFRGGEQMRGPIGHGGDDESRDD
jgi:hypothetical protein